MIGLLVVLLSGASGQARFAAPGLSHPGVDERVADLISDHLAQQLVIAGLSVTTGSDIAQLVGMERQRQLLGCSDSSASCLAELAGALGVAGLVTGTVGKLDSGYVVNVKLIATNDGRGLAAASGRFKNDVEIIDWLTRIAPDLASRALATLGGADPKTIGVSLTPTATVRSRAWIPLVATGVAVIAGVALLVNASAINTQIRDGDAYLTEDPSKTSERLKAAVASGQASQAAGFIALGLGVACAALSGAMFLFGGGDGPQVAMAFTGDAAFVQMGLVIP